MWVHCFQFIFNYVIKNIFKYPKSIFQLFQNLILNSENKNKNF